MSAQPMPLTQIRLTIPQGILALCDQAAKRIKGGERVWFGGLRDVLVETLQASGIPAELTVVDAARHFGILNGGKKKRRSERSWEESQASGFASVRCTHGCWTVAGLRCRAARP